MLIIKNILTKIKIHPSTYFFLVLAILTGNFMSIILISILLLGHECGHFLTAYFLKWDTDKIVFYPFGGIAKFKNDINTPLKEEILVLIMGPISQIILYLLLTKLPLSPLHLSLLTTIHYNVLFFNLLPLYPLDGGRILQCFSCYFFPYKKSFKMIYILSFFLLGIFFILFMQTKHLNFLLLFFFLSLKLFQEKKKIKYYLERFFLERYLKKYPFKRRKIIQKEEEFMRDCEHLIKVGNRYLKEKEYLKRKYEQGYGI